MTVGVIIPAYNSLAYLVAAVDSVLAQSHADWRLVIVDDGSTNGDTSQLARRCAALDVRIESIHQTNGGVAAARNRGRTHLASAVTSLLFLDHDDALEPNALTHLVAALQSQQPPIAAHGRVRVMDSTGELIPSVLERGWALRRTVRDGRRVAIPAHEPTSFGVVALTTPLASTGQLLVAADVFDDIGGFDPACTPKDDWDLTLRISLLGPIAFVDRPVLRWREHDANTSRNHDALDVSAGFVRDKIAALPDLTPDQADVLLRARHLERREAARIRIGWGIELLKRHDIVGALKQLRYACMEVVGSLPRIERPAPIPERR